MRAGFAWIARNMSATALERHVTPAVAALVGGALLIGMAPIFVRSVDVGPGAAAFWRLLLALPVLALLRSGQPSVRPRHGPHPNAVSVPSPHARLHWLWLAGLFFAADLAFWHHAIVRTSVANATLLANLAPVFVTLAAWRWFGERIDRLFALGLLLALAGAATLVADSLRIGQATALGDLYAVIAALFYAGYLLGVSRQRRRFSTLQVMVWTTAAGMPMAGLVAWFSGEVLWPPGLRDWVLLGGLALLSHVGGQGLIAYALAHLPASFTAVSLLVQPVAAAGYAWLLLGERFGAQQALGGIIVLAGILLCRRAQSQPRQHP